MPLTTIAGPVSGLRIDTTTVTNVDTTNASASTTTRSSVMHFRIGNRAAYMKVTANLTNGDLITAAGTDKSGEFEVTALKNHTTNLIYWVTAYPLWIGIVVSVLGFIMLGMLIGIFILPVGLFMAFQTSMHQKKLNEAFALLKAAPAPTS